MKAPLSNEFVSADATADRLQGVCESDYGMRATVIETLRVLISTIQLDGDAGFPCWGESDLQRMVDKLSA